MRTLTDHKLNGLNEAIAITVLDEPGQGGACHKYRLELLKPVIEDISPGSSKLPKVTDGRDIWEIDFQNGPIQEAGYNGLSQEALLAVVIDRLRSFQEGTFKCRENAIALTHIEDALMWLQKRTRDRMARGVEGTNVK